MAYNDHNNREDLSRPSRTLQGAVVSSLGEALKGSDDEGPRQHPVMRWLNFVVIMIVLGGIIAGLMAWWTYSSETNTGMSSRSVRYNGQDATPITDERWNEIKGDCRRSAFLGFGIGAALGACYMVRCLVRGVDP
jgi:hypothetical protein